MIAFQEERFCKRRVWKCVSVFGDMSSKIDVFSEYREWENEYEKSNNIVMCLAMLLRFSIGGWLRAYEGQLWAKWFKTSLMIHLFVVVLS